jgi:hypothetical protein
MAQLIKKKFIGDGQVDGSKILLDDVKSIKVVDSTDAEIDLIKLDTNDKVVVSNDLVVEGDLVVQGVTTTIESQTLEVVDANILINKGGTQSVANTNGAGLTVEMTDAVDAKLAYDSSLASKFKIGEEGSEQQIVTVGHTQALSNKTIDADSNTISNLEVDNLKSGVLNTSSSLAGASDAQVPSALAVKSYVDTEISDLDAVYHKIGGQSYGLTAKIGSLDASDINIVRNDQSRILISENNTTLSAAQNVELNAGSALVVNRNSALRLFVGEFDTQVVKALGVQNNNLFNSTTRRLSINPNDNGFHSVWMENLPSGEQIEFGAFASTDVSGGTTALVGSRVLSTLAGDGSYSGGSIRVATSAESGFSDLAANLQISSGNINLQTASGFIKGTGAAANSGNIVLSTGAAAGTGSRGIVTLDGAHIDVTNKQIKNVSAPTVNGDAANKLYVDTAVSGLQSDLDAVEQDVADLVTLSGVAANSVNLGAFTGATLSDTETVKSALQSLETALELDQQALANHLADAVDAHDASAISVSPAVNGQSTVQAVLEDHESRIDVLESATAPVFFKEKFVIATSVAPSTITLTHTPLANSIVAFVDRLAIHEGAGEDYTVSGNVITILNPGNGNGQIGNGDTVYVTYQYIP